MTDSHPVVADELLLEQLERDVSRELMARDRSELERIEALEREDGVHRLKARPLTPKIAAWRGGKLIDGVLQSRERTPEWVSVIAARYPHHVLTRFALAAHKTSISVMAESPYTAGLRTHIQQRIAALTGSERRLIVVLPRPQRAAGPRRRTARRSRARTRAPGRSTGADPEPPELPPLTVRAVVA